MDLGVSVVDVMNIFGLTWAGIAQVAAFVIGLNIAIGVIEDFLDLDGDKQEAVYEGLRQQFATEDHAEIAEWMSSEEGTGDYADIDYSDTIFRNAGEYLDYKWFGE